MNFYKNVFLILGMWGLSQQSINAKNINLCVFDIMGSSGPTMDLARDYAIYAKQFKMEIRPKVYTTFKSIMRDFDQQKCDGIVIDNFNARPYNRFIATIGAIAAIPDYKIAQQLIYTISSPRLAYKLKENNYEVVGYMPYGFAYLISKDRNIDTLEKAKGLRIGVLDADPTQKRMAERVGMIPILTNIDDGPDLFLKDKVDIGPAPSIAYEPFEGEKLLGKNGGIIDYPMALITIIFIIKDGNYSDDFGQKSREWFAKKSPQIFRMVSQWDAKIPQNKWVKVQNIDRPSYDHLASQLRKEFIENKL